MSNIVDKKLTQALENLVSRGEMTREDKHKVEVEFLLVADGDGSKRKVLSEIGGYLGGIFILISLLILFGQRWRNISRITQVSFFSLAAILLFTAALMTGKSSRPRARLAGLLSVVSAICATFAIIVIKTNEHGLVTLGILIGWLVTSAAFILFRTILGEFSLACYSLALGISGADFLFPHFYNGSYLIALVFLSLGSIWLYLANNHLFNRGFGDALAMAAFFLSGQIFFSGSLHTLTYLICIEMVVLVILFYSRAPEWPLLVGGIAAITVGAGEFVGSTLGGSLGAALGLLTSGVFFVTGSIYSLRRSKNDILKVENEEG
jgi:hypothetical protein